jgi:hypothetical protein
MVLVPEWVRDIPYPDLAERLAIEKACVIMIDCDVPSSRTNRPTRAHGG